MKQRIWEKIQRNKRRREEAANVRAEMMIHSRSVSDDAFALLNRLLNPKTTTPWDGDED